MTTKDLSGLNLSDLSEATLSGNGIFDVLMRAVNAHILNEYKEQRISRDAYADVYLSAVQAVLNNAATIYIQQAQIKQQGALLNQQIISEKAQTETEYQVFDDAGNPVLDASGNPTYKKYEGLLGAQIAVHESQKVAFNQDINLKVMKQYLDSFSVIFSQDNTLPMPDIVKHTGINTILNKALKEVYPDLVIP